MTAYFRGLLKGNVYWESVNGCPSIVAGSEPAMVVRRNSVGNLIVYLHFKNWKQKEPAVRNTNNTWR